MVEQARVSGVSIKVDGADLDEALLSSVSLVQVDESVQLPDAFTIRLPDPFFEAFDAATFRMGSKIEIAFSSGGDMMIVTQGEVTAISVDQNGGRHDLVVHGLDVTHRLHRGPRSRSFNQMTDSDIASQIANEYGFDPDVDGTSEVYEYVIQSNQSDFAFLYERAQRIGYDLWVADEKLHFKENPRAAGSPPALKWGDNLQRFRARFSSSERCDEVTVRGWDPVANTAIVGKATNGDHGTTAPAAAELADEATAAFGSVSRAAGQFPVSTQAEADALAQSLLLRASGGEVVARGEALGDPRIGAGARVEVSGVGERLSGEYVITEVQHVYRTDAPYVTRFVSGPKEASGLVDVLGGREASGWGSLVLATVTNTDDPEGLGRVKVRFVDLEETESQWAFLVAPGAGNQRGLQLVPENGDTVVVGFEHDDHRRPLILGGLWSSTDPPPNPSATQDGTTVSRILRSTEGHRIEMLDESEGKIVITLGDGAASLTLTSAETALAGTQVLKFEATDIEIEASSKLTLKGAQVEVAGSGPVEVSGTPIQLN